MNVKTFNSTVQTFDLQAELDAAGPNCVVRIPNAVCKLANPVVFDGACHIIGEGPGSTLLIDFDNVTDAITLGSSTYAYNVNTTIENLRIVSTAADKCQNVFYFTRCHRLRMRNVQIGAGASATAVVLQACIWPDVEVAIGHIGEAAYVNYTPTNGIYVLEQVTPAYQSNVGKIHCVISGLPGYGLKMGAGNFGSTQWEVSGTIEAVGGNVINADTIKHLTVHDLYATDGNTGDFVFTDCQYLTLEKVNAFATGNIVYITNCNGLIFNCNLAGLELDSDSRFTLINNTIGAGQSLVDEGLTEYIGHNLINYPSSLTPSPWRAADMSSPINMAPNAGFEDFGSPPTGWVEGGVGSVAWTQCGDGLGDTTKHFAPHCAQAVVTGGTVDLTIGAAELAANLSQFFGKYISIAVWINCDTYYSPRPHLEVVATAVSGNITTYSYTMKDFSTLSSTWQQHIVSIRVPEDCTSLVATLMLPNTSTTYIAEPVIQHGFKVFAGYVPSS